MRATEMETLAKKGRLSEEFRGRSKSFAQAVIRFFVDLPRARDEVRVLGRQLLRSGTFVASHAREASRARSDGEFASKLGGALQELMNLNSGWSFCVKNAGLNQP